MACRIDPRNDCNLGRRLAAYEIRGFMMRGQTAARWVVWCLLCIVHSGIANAAALLDARGKPFTPIQARRIVTLAPHIAEIVAASGAAGRIVGVSRYSDYPQAVKRLPVIGDAARLDIERIVALRPDIVIGWLSGNSRHDFAQLERLGIRVFVTESRRLADIPKAWNDIAMAIGGDASASIKALTEALARQRTRPHSPRLSVFYQIWAQPPMTLSGAHWVSDVLELCGGRNIFAELKPLAPTVSIESILARNPDVIMAAVSDNDARIHLDGWRRYPQLRAVRSQRLYAINADLLHRPTPRLVGAIDQVCAVLDRARASQ